VGKLTSAERAKDKRLKTVYNTTLEAQNAQKAEQGNGCAICGRSFDKFMMFQDHDHKCCPRRLKTFCGKCNRGLLCYLCNKHAVGLIEWLRKMDIPLTRVVEYVQTWDAEITKKGGYEPKEKKSSKVRRKQKSV
jgi:Recombination endonuclease VII